jgi:CheY-like chemotaxis protein
MSQESSINPSEPFVKALRTALNHLYDPESLRHCTLTELLGVSNRFDTPSALQNLLTKAIDGMRPGSNTANKVHAQTTYEVLLYRYVQQFNQEEIANQLGISVRHLRRFQGLAIEELACRLWEQYDLDNIGESLITISKLKPVETPIPGALAHELDWLKDSYNQAATDITATLNNVRAIIQPLGEQHKVELRFPETTRGMVLMHPVAFQQVLLNLLSLAVQQAAGRTVDVTITEHSHQWMVGIQGTAAPTQVESELESQTWLETVRDLVKLGRGELEWKTEGSHFAIHALFQAIDPVDVLVIDDNMEIITIMQRFVEETPYQVNGLVDPSKAIDLALETQPDLIVLDIMMPQIDGLQMLSRLKHHPGLGKVPVLICSVLPQKDLAASLGASGFIQKPIRREAFIAALDKARSLSSANLAL